ncbi:MAG TPA: hypothetical protein EYP57_01785 [Thermodesulfobacteriaceae bacterium]|nr:hypothetical protein [Thermodesulfobacteriaceae bacterium]
MQSFGIAGLLSVGVIFKTVLFFLLLTRFNLRARTSMLASLSLATYSEFGLLVASTGYKNNWINSEWLIILAIVLSITLIAASPLNSLAHRIYSRFSRRLKPFETKTRLPGDQIIDPGDAEVAIFGMGRVGTGAYDDMHQRYGKVVIGIDFDEQSVTKHRKAGRNVILGDPTDPDFWERTGPNKVKTVLLTLPEHQANMLAIKQITSVKFRGSLAATAKFDDQIEELKASGADIVYNLYGEAGYGFAKHVCQSLNADCSLQSRTGNN